MKKTILKSLVALIATTALSLSLVGCGANSQVKTETKNEEKTIVGEIENKTKNEEKIAITTTVFPIYDLTRELTNGIDTFEISILLDKSVDLHNFQPSAQDIASISNSKVMFYVGGESDEWVEDVKESTVNSSNVQYISLIDVIPNAYEEEEVEGMESEDEEEHSEEMEEVELDEHIWTSPKNAIEMAKAIETELVSLSPENKERLDINLTNLISQLVEIDNEYKEVIKNAKNDTLVFADRFPFLYVTKEYGLNYYAAFKGCSAETEASFETIKFLANKVDELGLKYVITIEGSNCKIANTVIDTANTQNIEIVELNSMQSVPDYETTSYLAILRYNIDQLGLVLN